MTTVPTPVLLLATGLALAAVILLWKLLATAGLIGLGQWAVTTQTEDPAALLVAYGLPALVVAVLLRRAARRPSRAESSRPLLHLRRQEVSR